MLLETDAPWLSPYKDAAKLHLNNVPWNISESAKVIGKIKGIGAEEVLRITESNARKAFGI